MWTDGNYRARDGACTRCTQPASAARRQSRPRRILASDASSGPSRQVLAPGATFELADRAHENARRNLWSGSAPLMQAPASPELRSVGPSGQDLQYRPRYDHRYPVIHEFREYRPRSTLPVHRPSTTLARRRDGIAPTDHREAGSWDADLATPSRTQSEMGELVILPKGPGSSGSSPCVAAGILQDMSIIVFSRCGRLAAQRACAAPLQ